MPSRRTVDDITRIQLEGHLERVERQVDQWRAAAVALKSNGWAHDLRWLSLLQGGPAEAESARVVSSKLVPGENDRPLRDLAAAQAMVLERAASRLAGLGQPVIAVRALELLAELKLKRPLHILRGQRAGTRMDFGGRLFVALFGGFILWLVLTVALITVDPNHGTPSFLTRMILALGTIAAPLGWAISTHLRSRRRLVLTEEKLSSEGGTPTAIALPHLAQFTATAEANEWRLTASSSQSPPLEPVETSADPKELLAWLEQQGVKVTTLP